MKKYLNKDEVNELQNYFRELLKYKLFYIDIHNFDFVNKTTTIRYFYPVIYFKPIGYDKYELDINNYQNINNISDMQSCKDYISGYVSQYNFVNTNEIEVISQDVQNKTMIINKLISDKRQYNTQVFGE